MGARRHAGKSPRPGKKGKAAALPADMYDDAELFRRDKELMLEDGQEEEQLDADEINPVFGLDEEESDMDSDDDINAGGKLAKIAAAEKAIKRQLALAKGEDEGDEDEDDEDDGHKWGSRKSTYYNAEDVDVDFDSDDEAAQEEGEEALRMQKEAAQQLLPQDLGLDEDDVDEEDEDDEEGVSDAAAEGTLGAAAKLTEGVHTERIQKQLSSMTDAEKMQAVASDAPELLSMLTDLKSNMLEVRSRVAPLLREVREGGLATQDGISYLEAKHILLLSYCINVMFYMLLKLEGRPVRDHPVIARLVQIRAYLDKIRPIDKKLQYQVEKLLKAAEAAASGRSAGANGQEDPLSFKPNPDALVSKLDELADDDDGAQVYRPPKLNPMAMDDPDKESQLAREKRRQKATLRKAQNNQFIRDLEAELMGAPEEVRELGAGMDTIDAMRERQRLEARARVEEDLMVRVPLTKEERKRMKAQRRAGLSGRALIDDFADDVAGLIEADGGAGAADPFLARLRLNQKHGADLASERASVPSADAELPRKGDLGERRAKYDALKARQLAQLSAMEDNARNKRERVEDDFYQAAKEASQAKKKAKLDRRAHPDLLPPAADPVLAAPRKINSAIESNRGLTPHRRKDLKNPRVKAKVKFAKAEVRRKGQVQDVKRPEGPYGGEATGIKSRVSRSVKL